MQNNVALASNCAEEASSWCASTTTKGSCFGSNIVSNTQLLSKHGKKNALRGNDASMLIGKCIFCKEDIFEKTN